MNSLTPDEKLGVVVHLQERAYKLLKWLQHAMDEGWYSPATAHIKMSSAQAMRHWLLEHIENIPNDCRPNIEEGEINIFCNLFFVRVLFLFHVGDVVVSYHTM